MKNTMYAIKLTAIICVAYGLVLGFMLMVNSLWNSIGDTYTKNMVAYILLCMILAYEYVERVGRKKNETK